MNNPLFTMEGVYHIFRWVHFMAGITWIGLLYYFNFVQGGFFAETDGQTKQTAIRQLVPRALWWFRWGAAYTFLTGILMLWHRGHSAGHEIYTTSWGVWILTGSALATLMAYNVWFVIWPNQRIVIASATSVATGGTPDSRAGEAGARALVASRTNVMFSIPMLFLMGAASHLPLTLTEETDLKRISLMVAVIILGLEVNALKGKLGLLTTVRGVITCGFALWAILYFGIVALV